MGKGLLLFGLIGLMTGCQTFVSVDTKSGKPVFDWNGDAPVRSLTVMANDDCDGIKSRSPSDRIWWQISGNLKPPITYGVLPPGATQQAAARPFARNCGAWTVMVSDANMQGEKATFRP